MVLETIHMTLPMRGSIFASVLNKPLGLVVSAPFPKGTGAEESYDEKMGRMVEGRAGTPILGKQGDVHDYMLLYWK